MLQVGLVQPNFQTGPKHLNSWYLPYSLGCIWSYVAQYKDISDNFAISEWVFQRPNISETVEKLQHCDVILASMYMWNIQYCYKLLKELKTVNPSIKVIAGGPEIPWRDPNFFDNHPYIDCVVVNEGEQGALDALRRILAGEELPKTMHFERMKNLDEFPSPYLTGVFDQLLIDYPDIEWVPTLETDRGCPFKCTYCDWGGLTASKMYKFHMDRIRDEMFWCAERNMPYFSLTASNYGAFKRDIEIADIMIECKNKTGNPEVVSASYAKNNTDAIFQIGRKLLDAGIQNAPAASFQTTTPHVLKNVKRDNMKINSVAEVTKKAKQYNLPMMTELIMGLPGETYESWLKVIDEMFINDIINMDIFYLQILENAPMNVSDMEKFDLKTFRAYDYYYETTSNIEEELAAGTAESVGVIASTSTMSEQDMYKVSMYSWFVVGMHSYGLSTQIADYMYKMGIEYSEFYTALMEYVRQDKIIDTWFNEHKDSYKIWKSTGHILQNIGGYKINGGWKGINSFMPILQKNEYVDKMIQMVSKFVETFYNVDPGVLVDYRTLAPLTVKQYGRYVTQPLTVDLMSDILDCKQVIVEDRYNHFPPTAENHLEFLFFGRRRSWQTNKISPVLDK